jgi:hypothetical protein
MGTYIIEDGDFDIFEDDLGDWDRILSKWTFNGYLFSFVEWADFKR